MSTDKVNILLVDDQPAKLLSYEVILRDLDENLVMASSASEALSLLLKSDFAVVLIDVCMPDLDGFELAAMIREHPRFEKIAIIFISAVLLGDTDRLRGYEMGAVDYVPVPVIPDVLRAKVRIFTDLYRKTRDLEVLNQKLESRVAERTAELESSHARLLESERRRSVALSAGKMGSWEWDAANGYCIWDRGQFEIFGLDALSFAPTVNSVRPLVHPDDWSRIAKRLGTISDDDTIHDEIRLVRPDGTLRWCICAAAITRSESSFSASGVTIDITERKLAEERQSLLAREVDHRARNALAVVQAIVRLTRGADAEEYGTAVEGRIRALAQAHTLLSETRWQGAHLDKILREELAPYLSVNAPRVELDGPTITLSPDMAQTLALALHELATNSAKYGALSSETGTLLVRWQVSEPDFRLDWIESGGPPVSPPSKKGFGTKILTKSVSEQLRGRIKFDWKPAGLHFFMQIPHQTRPYSEAHKPTNSISLKQYSDQSESAKQAGGYCRRVLLVEDEAMVSMMMIELLTDLGFSIVGPYANLGSALEASVNESFDCAILDINLGGKMVYPLASVLLNQKKPFIFVTGYESDIITEEYRGVPVLQKPVSRDSMELAMKQYFGWAIDGFGSNIDSVLSRAANG